MFISQPGGHAAPGRAIEKADLDKERLIHLFQGVLFLREASCQRIQPHRASVVFLDDGQQQAPIELIKTVGIDSVQL